MSETAVAIVRFQRATPVPEVWHASIRFNSKTTIAALRDNLQSELDYHDKSIGGSHKHRVDSISVIWGVHVGRGESVAEEVFYERGLWVKTPAVMKYEGKKLETIMRALILRGYQDTLRVKYSASTIEPEAVDPEVD